MTPYLGKGATNAIVDAIALVEALKAADEKNELVPRLAEYESSMLKRGFAAAKESMLVHHLVFAAGDSPWRARFRNLFLYLWDLLTSHPSTPKNDPFPGKDSPPWFIYIRCVHIVTDPEHLDSDL